MGYLVKYPELPEGLCDDADFSWDKYDKLGRHEIAQQLTRLLDGVVEPFVLSLNSSWGTGKTFFIKLWEKELKDIHGYPVIYINAWETDFSDEPFIAFVESIETFCKSQIEGDAQTKIKAVSSQIVCNAGKLIKKSPKYFGKALRYYLVKKLGNVVDDVISDTIDVDKQSIDCSAEGSNEGNDVWKMLATEAAKNTISVFEEFRKQRQERDRFREQLSSLALAFNDCGKKLPLIIFIDELDRCRPDYTLIFLEEIKHIFLAKHVVFVLAVDKTQLCNTITSVYGVGVNASEYLRKFIDIEFEMPTPAPANFTKSLVDSYIKSALVKGLDYANISMNLLICMNAFHLSFRDLKQLSLRIAIATKVYSLEDAALDVFIITSAVRFSNPIAYEDLKEGSPGLMVQEMLAKEILMMRYKYEDIYPFMYFIYLSTRYCESNVNIKEKFSWIEKFEDDIKNGQDRDKIITYLHLVQTFQDKQHFRKINMNMIIQMVEFSWRF